nr:alpha/beta hydrolase fold domain-containing protein [Mycobacterium leprae]
MGGDSAGGNLPSTVCQLVRAADGPAPVLQWLLYPRTDFIRSHTHITRSMTLLARGFLLTKRDRDFISSAILEGLRYRAR